MANEFPEPSGVECRLISPTDEYTGKQGLDYLVGISAETVGSRALHLQLVTIHPEEGPRPTNTPRTKRRFTRSKELRESGMASNWSITPS